MSRYDELLDAQAAPAQTRRMPKTKLTRLIDMVIRTDDLPESRGKLLPCLYGHPENLTALTRENANAVEAFISEVRQRRFMYVCSPPVSDQAGMPTRYSCVGFVLECYRHLGSPLLEHWDKHQYPSVSRAHLCQLYPDLESIFTNPDRLMAKIMREIGLPPENNAWPVILPAYLFHAFDRNSSEELFKPAPHHRDYH